MELATISAPTDSDDDINPFIDEDEREELLGDLFSDEEEQEDDPEVEDEGPLPAKKARFMPSSKTVKMLKAATEKPIKNGKKKEDHQQLPSPFL